jgi:integrase
VDLLNRSIRIQQAAYRGSLGSPKTKGTLPLPESLAEALRRHYEISMQRDGLVFPTRSGGLYSDTNLLARHLKPAGKQIPNPLGGLAYAQAQLGHAHISTTMDIYTQPTPDHQRAAVERMPQLVMNGDELTALRGESQFETLCIQ